MRWITLVFGMILVSCTNMESIEPTHVSDSSFSARKTQLMTVFSQYRGTPYRYGGVDGNGFDCSGFINVAFREAFGMNIPRTTESIAKSGKPIRRDQLQTGDIIFFQTGVKQLHAGIYTGSGKFIHASSSKGVIQSSLENRYWHQRYIKARRVL